MAKRCVLSVGPSVIKEITEKRWLVDIEFCDQETLDKAISMGFEVDAWEKKNNNKVLVKKDGKDT